MKKRIVIILVLTIFVVGLMNASINHTASQEIISTSRTGMMVHTIEPPAVGHVIDEDHNRVGNTRNHSPRNHSRGEVYLGDPDSETYTAHLPGTFFNQHSVNQTIYHEEMIGRFGVIQEIIYPRPEVLMYSPHHVMIWMAQTDKYEYLDTDDWIPFEEFTLVFDSHDGYPFRGFLEDVYIPLDTPFDYTFGNLVIMTKKTGSTWDNFPFVRWLFTAAPADRGYCTIHSLRQPPSEGFTPWDYYPSEEDNEWVRVLRTRPNVILNFADDLDFRIGYRGFSGVNFVAFNTPVNYVVNLRNSGNLAFDDYTISLMHGTNVLTTIPGQSIRPQEVVAVNVPYSFTTVGNFEVSIRVDLPEGYIWTNSIPVRVFPPGYSIFKTETVNNFSNLPIHDSWNRTSAAQAIYREDMLGGLYGTVVEMIFFSLTSSGENPEDCVGSMFLVHTERDSAFVAGWAYRANYFEPLSDYELVFEDVLPWNVEAGGNVPVSFVLTEPFDYLGGNIALLSHVPWFDGPPITGDRGTRWSHMTTPHFSWTATAHNTTSLPLSYDWEELFDIAGICFFGRSVPYVIFVSQTAVRGAIAGRVVDEQQQPLSDIRIALQGYDNVVYTNADGRFLLDTVTPGIYSIVVSHDDFYSQTISDVAVLANQVTTVADIELSSLSGIDFPIELIRTTLKANFPNPFNPSTMIYFDVAELQNVQIEIFNVRGQRVKTLVNDIFTAGSHRVEWEGVDNAGRSVGSGVYFYRMTTENYSSTRKMLLMK